MLYTEHPSAFSELLYMTSRWLSGLLRKKVLPKIGCEAQNTMDYLQVLSTSPWHLESYNPW